MYTWRNKHAYESFTKEKLDRVVANNLCKGMLNGVRVEGIAVICSNHKLLVVSFTRGFKSQYRRRTTFRVGVIWIREKECADIEEQEWQGGALFLHNLERVQTTLNNCSSALSSWSKQRNPITKEAIKEKYELLRRLTKTEGPYNVNLIKNKNKK